MGDHAAYAMIETKLEEAKAQEEQTEYVRGRISGLEFALAEMRRWDLDTAVPAGDDDDLPPSGSTSGP